MAVAQSPSFRNGRALVQSAIVLARLAVLIELTVLVRFFPAPPATGGGRYDSSNLPRSSMPSVCANFSSTHWRSSASGASHCTRRTTFASSSTALTTSLSSLAALRELDLDIALEDCDEGGRGSDVVPERRERGRGNARGGPWTEGILSREVEKPITDDESSASSEKSLGTSS
jgi:hypothetical protein